MDFPAKFPQALRDYFARNYPLRSNSETLLSGMSGSYVYRVSFGDIAVIVKSSQRPQETNFYREFAPFLREQGVAIPKFYWLGEEAGHYWLALENILGFMYMYTTGPTGITREHIDYLAGDCRNGWKVWSNPP